MIEGAIRTIAHSRIGGAVQSMPGVGYLATRAYCVQRKLSEGKYIEEKNGYVVVNSPTINEVYINTYTGDYDELRYIEYILDTLNGGEVIFDVGANVGLHSLCLAQIGEVVAFEPFPSNVAKLKENIGINVDGDGFNHISIKEVALSNESGQAVMEGNDVVETEASLNPDGEISVEMRRLDDLQLPAPDAIKVDIEGAELSMLEGAKNTLQEHHPDIFLETHPEKMKQYGYTDDDLFRFLQDLDYKRETIISIGGAPELLHLY